MEMLLQVKFAEEVKGRCISPLHFELLFDDETFIRAEFYRSSQRLTEDSTTVRFVLSDLDTSYERSDICHPKVRSSKDMELCLRTRIIKKVKGLFVDEKNTCRVPARIETMRFVLWDKTIDVSEDILANYNNEYGYPVRKYAEVRNDYYSEQDNYWRIDAWETDDDNEQGKVVAFVNGTTGDVAYVDCADSMQPEVIEAISQLKHDIEANKLDNIITMASQLSQDQRRDLLAYLALANHE